MEFHPTTTLITDQASHTIEIGVGHVFMAPDIVISRWWDGTLSSNAFNQVEGEGAVVGSCVNVAPRTERRPRPFCDKH